MKFDVWLVYFRLLIRTMSFKQGEVEGVKYDRISAVLVNAVKEQQIQVESLEKQLADLKAVIASHLTALKIRRISKGKKYVK